MKSLSLLACLVVFSFSLDHHWIMKDRKTKSWLELRDEGLVRQKYDYSCGSASLATIMTYFYASSVTEKEIWDFVVKKKNIDFDALSLDNLGDLKDKGLSFLDLSEFAESKGFKAIGLALDFKSLKQLKVPAIVFLNIRKTEHFSVYKGMDDRYVYLADSSFGNIKISLKRFKKAFYQRDDKKHPGKILAILPKNIDRVVGKPEFMQIKQSSHLQSLLREKISTKSFKAW